MVEPITPVAPQERILTIDIIRACALFGVIIANFTTDNANVRPSDGWTGISDQLVYWPLKFFIDDKAMAVFCFLFGLGFAIMMLRAEAKKTNFILLHIRRMIALFIIGGVALILTNQTILHLYAMVGMLLLFVYKLPLRWLPYLGFLCVLLPFSRNLMKQIELNSIISYPRTTKVDTAVLERYKGIYRLDEDQVIILLRKGNVLFAEGPSRNFYLYGVSDSEFIRRDVGHIFSFPNASSGSFKELVISRPNGEVSRHSKIEADISEALKMQVARRRQGINSIGWREFVVSNFRRTLDLFSNWSWRDFFWGGNMEFILSFFIFGVYTGRRHIFSSTDSHKKFRNNVLVYGSVTGVITTANYLALEGWNLVSDQNWSSFSSLTKFLIDFSWQVGVIALCFFYISWFMFKLEDLDLAKRMQFLAPVGRMGLTNYILHTIPYLLIFHFGLELNGKVGPFVRLVFALPVCIGLIFFSQWWFSRFSIGPAEWLWRSITYLKIQPISRADIS